MDENPNGPTAVHVQRLADVFEKTLLEILILDSLYGSSSIGDYVKNVLQACIEDLRDSGTLKTLAGIVADDNERKREGRNEQKDGQELRRWCSNDEQYVARQYVSLEKKLQTLKRKDEEIDSIIEKCTVRLFKPSTTIRVCVFLHVQQTFNN